MNNIIYDCRWSNQLTKKFVSDFIYVFNNTWGTIMTEESFLIKYSKNIYGESLLTVVYLDDKPVAVDAMWRNDIEGREAYQTIDTCVLKECRGMGIFREITQKELELLGENKLVYGYPNHNSLPGYIKFGWTTVQSNTLRPYISNKIYRKHNSSIIDYNYAKWYFLPGRDRIFHIKRNGHYFLVKSMSRKMFVQVISECDYMTAKIFDKWNGHPILIYLKSIVFDEKTNYGHIVALNYNGENIPMWKCDTF